MGLLSHPIQIKDLKLKLTSYNFAWGSVLLYYLYSDSIIAIACVDPGLHTLNLKKLPGTIELSKTELRTVRLL